MPEDILQNLNTEIYKEFENENIRKHFSKEELQDLEEGMQEIKLQKGDTIIEEESRPQGVYYVKSGTAKLYKVGFNGKEQILRFAKEGDIIGYRSLLCDEKFSASATALEDMEIMYIPEYFFHKLLEVSPRLAFDMLKRIAHELGEAGRTITILAQKTVRERLAEVLILLEQKLGTDENGFINISLTREEMANLIGTATESAIRLISEFKTDEYIEVEGRKIKILDHQKLNKLAHVNY